MKNGKFMERLKEREEIVKFMFAGRDLSTVESQKLKLERFDKRYPEVPKVHDAAVVLERVSKYGTEIIMLGQEAGEEFAGPAVMMSNKLQEAFDKSMPYAKLARQWCQIKIAEDEKNAEMLKDNDGDE